MTHTYTITGMTCNNCVTTVKNALLKLDHILAADVQLKPPQATITMDKHIPVEILQSAIGSGKYTISEANAAHEQPLNVISEKNSYYPIFLIFAYLVGTTLLIQISRGRFYYWMEDMSIFMAGFFLLFSFFKLLNLKGFIEGYSTYDIIAKKFPTYGYIYPFLELLLGIAFLTNFQPIITNVATVVIMGVSSIGVIQSLLRKQDIQCACLGTIIKLPLSKITLFEDLLMITMSLIMLYCYMRMGFQTNCVPHF